MACCITRKQPYKIGSSYFPPFGFTASGPVGMISPAASTSPLKYSIVFSNPSSTVTFGSQSISRFAVVMSAFLCVGSSATLGRYTIFAFRTALVANFGGKVVNSVFVWVTNIYWHVVVAIHELDQSSDQIVNVLEAASVSAVSVYCNVLVLEGLDDEVRHDTTIVGVHSGAEGVKNTSDADFDVVLAFVGIHHCFIHTLTLIVACLPRDGCCEIKEY